MLWANQTVKYSLIQVAFSPKKWKSLRLWSWKVAWIIIYVKLFSYESCVSCHWISGSFCQIKKNIVIPLPNWHNWITNRTTFYKIFNKYISGGGSKQILQAGSARELHESQCERASKAWINLDKKVVSLDSHCCYKSWKNVFQTVFWINSVCRTNLRIPFWMSDAPENRGPRTPCPVTPSCTNHTLRMSYAHPDSQPIWMSFSGRGYRYE